MYLLLTDETNIAPAANARFFAYGGLIVPLSELAELDERIRRARARFGYRAGDTLKFNTLARPAHVSVESATAAKNQVLTDCIELQCKFIAYVVLHDIARNRVNAMVEWAANTVLSKFQTFLRQQGAWGIVAVDRQPEGREFAHFVEKFSHGLVVDGAHVQLSRIKLFASTCINASNVSSAMDIALGSFRYCINQPRNVDAARTMLGNLTRMLWCERQGDTIYAIERGLVFRPRTVTRDDYRGEYDALLASINGLIADV